MTNMTMETKIDLALDAVGLAVGVATGIGVQPLAKEALTRITPEGLSTGKRICVSVATGVASSMAVDACKGHVKNKVKATRATAHRIIKALSKDSEEEVKTEEPKEEEKEE